MLKRAVQKCPQLTNLDNSECILVEFLNQDDANGRPSRSVGFQTFLTEVQRRRLPEIQQTGEEINISWPMNVNIQEASKMAKFRGDPKFESVTVKIIGVGGFIPLREELNKYNSNGHGSSTKDSRKDQARTKPQASLTNGAKTAGKQPSTRKKGPAKCTVPVIEQMLMQEISSDEDAIEDSTDVATVVEEDFDMLEHNKTAAKDAAVIPHPAGLTSTPGTSNEEYTAGALGGGSSHQNELAELHRQMDQVRAERARMDEAAEAARERERLMAEELARAQQEVDRMRAERAAQAPRPNPMGPLPGAEANLAGPPRNGFSPLRGMAPAKRVISRNRNMPYPLPTNYSLPEEIVRLAPRTKAEHYAAWIMPRSFDPDELGTCSLYAKKIRPTDTPKPALDPDRLNAVLNLCWALFEPKDKRFEGHFGEAARNQMKPYAKQWRRRNAREGSAD